MKKQPPKPTNPAAPPAFLTLIALATLWWSGQLPGLERSASAPATAPTEIGQPTSTGAPASPPLTKAAPPKDARELLERLHELDRAYARWVPVRPRRQPEGPGLFAEVDTAGWHPSYQATDDLCEKAEAYDADDDELGPEDRLAWVRSMQDMAPVKAALQLVPGASLEDMAAVWFGAGRGFEHVFCGELGGPPDKRHLGGYHWWDRHRRLALDGRASFRGGQVQGDPPGYVTGQFRVDFDGDGPGQALEKSFKGGFSLGHSPAALAVLGYVGVKMGWKPPITANINGQPVEWTLWPDREDTASLRTLWPRGG